jgi:hypothetical protein
MAEWQKQRHERQARLNEASRYARGKLVTPRIPKPSSKRLSVLVTAFASKATIRSRPIFLPRP